jgi:hypothetical protein
MPVLWPIIPITALNYAPADRHSRPLGRAVSADVYGADAITIGNITCSWRWPWSRAISSTARSIRCFRTRKWVGWSWGNRLAIAALGIWR